MLLTIDHETKYVYRSRPNYSIQTLRLTPQSHDGQKVRSWDVKVDGNATLHSFVDSFGNITHTLVIDQSHDVIKIRVHGEVETKNTNGLVLGGVEKFPINFYLRETSQTKADDAIRKLASTVNNDSENKLDVLHKLMLAIRAAITYQTGESHPKTTAVEALMHGAGVCQDHAHVFIAAARYLGYPARYVSGYLLHTATGEESEASHAWAEAFVPDLGWVGFDIANSVCINEFYVRTAIGLDYRDASPVRGVRRGGDGEKLTVSVRVFKQDEAAQQ